MIRVGAALLGPTPLGVRLIPTLAGSVGMLALLSLTRRIGDAGATLRAAILLACLPIMGVYGCVATPDTMVLAACAIVLAAVERALAAVPRSRRALLWWMAAGAALGLGFCSKYTAIHVPLGIVIAFVLCHELRARLGEPGPYLACLAALAVFAPVLLWNAGHDWISIRHQLGHGFGVPAGSPLHREVDLLSGQLLVASPILFVLLAIAVGSALRSGWKAGEPVGFIFAVISVTVLGFFAMSALFRPVHANWPALTYLPAVVLLATTHGGRWWKYSFRAGCFLGGLVVLAVYVHSAYPFLAAPTSRIPRHYGHGWEAIAAGVERARYSLSQAQHATRVAANRYQDAAELAFVLADHPTVFSLNINGRANQYDLWPGYPECAAPGDDLILVLEESNPTAEKLAAHFERVSAGELVAQCAAGHVIGWRRIWILEGWRGSWPAATSSQSAR
jgi:4-amino-4-deoxy-L-arabinose transferase-like glycosyltransferase